MKQNRKQRRYAESLKGKKESLVDKFNEMMYLHALNRGFTHRIYLHPTKGMRVVNIEDRDAYTKEYGLAVFLQTLRRCRVT